MNFNLSCFLILFVVSPVSRLTGQTEDSKETQDLMESLSDKAGEGYDYSELSERLDSYKKHPLDLNKATREDLQNFFFLSPLQISEFLRYRQENGRLAGIEELQVINYFDETVIRRLLPFVFIGAGPVFQPKGVPRKSEQNIIITYGEVLQKQKGYLPRDGDQAPYYQGSREHFLMRYRYRYDKRLSAALTVEKDPGEPFFPNKGAPGFDFFSGNIFYKGEGRLRKAVAGDYSLQFGQGASLWTGLSFGKGSAIASLAKQYSGLMPYTSANETAFLRGAAATMALGNILVTPFLSFRKLDASTDSSAMNVGISSLPQSGFHRSVSEIKNHNNISQTVYGCNAEYSRPALRAGAVWYRTGFSKTFLPGKYLYEKFDFCGQAISNGSIYYNYNWQNFYFFGEAAHSFGNGFSVVQGAMAALSRKLSAVMLYRNYQKNFYSFFSQGMAEASAGTAEQGLYTGLNISPGAGTEFSLYSDVFKFPWLRFGADAPSRGYEWFSQFTCSPAKKLKLTLRYRRKSKPENDDENQTVHFLEDTKKDNIRADLEFVKGAFTFRERVENSFFRKDSLKENGFLIYQDIIFKPMRARLSGSVRFALFDTDSYNSAIYAYENNLLYAYSIPGYQHSGTRFYVNARYRLSRNADLSARYAISSYINCDEIGSGPDEIEGHKRSDFNLQISFQF